ncbi:MAG TPA: phosphoglucosamine mutase [Planctomycetota bacterium]|jgi:phosphoglucosamine mutase|nr:phosphoglucosamine mutase [Planctomycetota bacterium]OQC21343.1 MAG: Phosphoglucosamine mutase [Planctomycetes bacterium ADurb.Bin069]HNR99674.1 phosphoglucosamine mutase [Planctomycetota bacterium]HNU25198.1 phosphoglucosamine mutase [Planctomycetota bacterium]HOE30565.1 phosphoglucosamine mutase [Planctomycetota bacterium]
MSLFGTDGVRGVPNTPPLDVDTVVRLGRAIARVRAPGGGAVCLARDTRRSGPFLVSALTAGLLGEGATVFDLGVLPTPGCAALTLRRGAAAGIVVSASHNPASDNGVKVFNAQGGKLSVAEELQLERETVAGAPPGRGVPGTVVPVPHACADYLDLLARAAPGLRLDGLRIVVDCANGATAVAAPELFRRLGAEQTVICDTPDRRDINDGCGSEHPEAACAEVRARGADLGIIFDGDGDRVIFIDDRGAPVDGDRVMAILAIDMAARGRLPGMTIVCTDYSNKGLDIALAPHGIEVVRAGVGDREVAAAMRARGCTLGGEQSGHLILTEFAPTGDGILTALALLAALRRRNVSLRESAAVMQPLPQILRNVDVAEKVPLAELQRTSHTITEAVRSLADRGRVYVRYSGTQRMLRVMVEGENKDQISDMADRIAATACEEIQARAVRAE